MAREKGVKRGRPAKSKPEEPATDPAAAAARITGAEDSKPATSTDRVRAYRKRQRAAESEPEKEPFVYKPDEGTIQATAVVARVVWDIAAPFARLKQLTDEQAARLGTALDPLVQKYLPLLADWQYELGAVMCVVAVARENAIPRENKDAREAGAVETGAGDGDANAQ